MRNLFLSTSALCLMLTACGEPAADTPATDTAATDTPAPDTPAPDSAATVEPAVTKAVDTTQTVAVATPEMEGKKVFAQCTACHSVNAADGNKVGPNLSGIVGRPSGGVAGFTYSPAMLAKQVTWDEATLLTYLEKPMLFVPGTKMAFGGIPDEGKRKALIAYLKNPAAAE